MNIRGLLTRVEALEAIFGRPNGALRVAEELRKAGFDVNDPSEMHDCVVVQCVGEDPALRAKLDDLERQFPDVLVFVVRDLCEHAGVVPANGGEEED